MNRFLLLLNLVFAAATAVAADSDTPLWLRYPAISPDGQTVVFSYKGDLFTVSAQGGVARQLTTHNGYDAYPVWSPDGRQIAFASDREGSLDVYLIGRDGGTPRRLTTHSANEVPMAFSDDGHVLFQRTLMPSARSILFPSKNFPQVYEVATDGSRPRLFSSFPMENISINSRGDLLFHDKKGYENAFRKHHQSAICRDIWLKSGDKFTKQTDFRGEDRNAVWAPGGQSFYYLSEQDGTFNVWYRQLGGTAARQITHHRQNPVRFLTASQDGTLCYAYDGEIYINKAGQEQRLAVSIVADRTEATLVRQLKSDGATSIALSPSGKEVAFVVRGDIYVTSVEYKTTKQITDTPEQERNVSFSPDGRSLVYDAERDGLWQIYLTKIRSPKEKTFTYATELDEERLTDGSRTSQVPKFSPDGKRVAYFEDRGALRVIDLKTKQTATVLDGKYNYSYSDGDLWFEWSPDSRWLLASYIGTGGWLNMDVALVSASGSVAPRNLTNNGYSDGHAMWALGGRAIVFPSDRAGYRSHGSWGAEKDVYIMFLETEAYERFRMTKEEKALKEEADKEAKKEDAKEKGKKKKQQKEPLQLDLENARDRTARLTVNSSMLGHFLLSPGGDTLYYQAAFEGRHDLWRHDLREGKTELVMKGIGGGKMLADSAFKNIFLLSDGKIKKIEIAGNKSKNVDFEATFNYKPYEERQYIFNHVWQQVKDKFYAPKLHGVDWEAYRETYQRFLPHINNNYDFSDMLSEVLGELNASHTGAGYRPAGAALATARLGVFLDDNHTGDGLLIEEVIPRSPLAIKKIKAGSIIEKIDGKPIAAGADYNHLLDGKAGKRVRLTIDGTDVVIKPLTLTEERELLYRRWVERNRRLVDSLSGGQLAYVHVKAMDSPSFRQVYGELLSDSNRNRRAAIVDERHNGGGWLHDDLCTLLSGKQYQTFEPHGKYIGRDPFNKWVKPSCVLICEDDYSNGHGFPTVYRELGIGRLIGTPVAGTMTAVWWETLIDPTLYFGVPQVGCIDNRGKYGENNELLPDIEVYNTPDDLLNGYDRQLEAAVKTMMADF